MAERRMICRSVICSDSFIELSYEAQALYFQLTIEADNFGFVSGVKKIMRSIGVKADALEALEKARYVIPFDSGVFVVRHWFVANYGGEFSKNDRLLVTSFNDELAQLSIDASGAYDIRTDSIGTPLESKGNPNTNQYKVTQYINKVLARQTTTNTNPTDGAPTEGHGEPGPGGGGGGAGGGGLPPEILAYAREAARGADHPAAYERKILERIRREGYKTIEEVLAADQRRQEQAAAEDVYDPEAYPDAEHFWDEFLGKV